MGRKASIQTTWSKGELDPDLSERIDLEHYYDSAASAPNSIFHPQGGFSDRGGTSLVSDADVLAAGTRRRLRRDIVPVALTADNLTANNGGTTTYLVDRDAATTFTTNACTAAVFVFIEVDLGVAQHVDLVDVIGFRTTDASSDAALAVQYWSGTTWVDFADPIDTAPRKHLRTTARTRRFGTAPGGPAGIRIAARYWRVVAVDAVGVGQILVSGLRLWQETERLSPIDVVGVARSQDATYELVVTARNIDVFERQRYVASIPLAAAGGQIDELTYSGGFDTLLVFHEQLETVRIVRQGSAGEWDVGPTPYADVPNLSEQIVFSGDQDEIQRLAFQGLEAGDVVFLALGDDIAPPLVFSTAAALAAQFVTALDALPGVAGGSNILVNVFDGTTIIVDVRFTGSNGKRAWPRLDAMTAAPAVVFASIVSQPGLKSTGKLFAADTGWPRCGAFVQQRLCVGGFRAAPKSLMFSRPGSWSYLDTSSPMTADLAFLRTLDTDRVEAITTIFVGRHLQVFTEASEWYSAAQTYDATQPTPMVRTTAHGVRRAVPVVFSDGASVFVQAKGKTLRDMVWDYTENSYGAEPLSVLAPQILSDVIDVAHRSARSVTEGNLLFLINGNGTAGCLTLLRGQNVVAGSPWSTSGAFLAAHCNVQHEVYFVVERDGERWLEKWQPDVPLDCATTVVSPAGAVVTGAAHLEGRTDVWAIADGEVLGPFTVTGGHFALGLAVVPARVTYGLLPPWSLRTQVLRSKLTTEMPFRPPARIYEVELAVRATGHLTLATSGSPAREVPLVRLGDAFADGGPLQDEDGAAPGLALFDRLYTGNVRMGGLLGFSRSPYVELGRAIPSPVHVKSLRMEIVQKAEE